MSKVQVLIDAASLEEMTVRDRQDFRNAVSDLHDDLEVLRKQDRLVIQFRRNALATIDLEDETIQFARVTDPKGQELADEVREMAPMFGVNVGRP